MKKKILNKLGVSNRLFSNVGVIFLANLGNNGIALLINIAVARWFSYEVFGQFSIAINIAMTVQAIAEFGINLTMIRLYKEYQEDNDKKNAIISWNVFFKLLQFIIIVIIAFQFSDSLSSFLMPGNENRVLVLVAIISGSLLLFWEFFKSYFQTQDKFRKIAAFTFIYSILRLVLMIAILFYGMDDNVVYIFLSVYAIPMVPILIVGFYGLAKELNLKGNVLSKLGEVEREYISYSKWVALAGISFILTQKVMIFLISSFLDLKSVSILSASLVFVSIFTLFNNSVIQVVFPKMAAFDDMGILEYKKKLTKILPLIIMLGSIVIIFCSLLMHYVLGEAYKESLPIFWVNSVGALIVTWMGFYSLALHSLKRPDLNGIVSVFVLFVFSIGGYLIIKVLNKGLMEVVVYYVVLLILSEFIKRIIINNIIKYRKRDVDG